LFAFHHTGASGEFVGGITDPMRVAWQGERLALLGPAEVEVA
jgi:beta-fructofuranosidase